MLQRPIKKALLYVHGKGGSAQEADRFAPLCPGYAVIGAEYTGDLPWETSEELKAQYSAISAEYDEVSLLTNSIGTYFAMLGLQGCAIQRALCISPILDMERLICDMLGWAGVSDTDLAQRGTIATSFGETLSWEYLCYVRSHPICWTVPTAILYARKDNLTSRQTVDAFVSRHGARLTVMEDGEHWFHTPEQLAFLDSWLQGELVRL